MAVKPIIILCLASTIFKQPIHNLFSEGQVGGGANIHIFRFWFAS